MYQIQMFYEVSTMKLLCLKFECCTGTFAMYVILGKPDLKLPIHMLVRVVQLREDAHACMWFFAGQNNKTQIERRG